MFSTGRRNCIEIHPHSLLVSFVAVNLVFSCSHELQHSSWAMCNLAEVSSIMRVHFTSRFRHRIKPEVSLKTKTRKSACNSGSNSCGTSLARASLPYTNRLLDDVLITSIGLCGWQTSTQSSLSRLFETHFFRVIHLVASRSY